MVGLVGDTGGDDGGSRRYTLTMSALYVLVLYVNDYPCYRSILTVPLR